MPNEHGVYVYHGNKEDAAFILEHFVKGTKWLIFEWGDLKGVFTVGERFELGGMLKNSVTHAASGKQLEVFLCRLEAMPYEHYEHLYRSD